ncbi:tetratricopeptide repeat protein [Leptolyngbya sp. ST-U4]|uniref:tetratricopeptide repeat protein n=1 Tax=Leptolyngbya sp. ST-U4 TaxID=2933912 RepID=UPI00199A7648|nr:tetratricopeptide repeat protein [Cyanobacteria bacterium FACHB-502]
MNDRFIQGAGIAGLLLVIPTATSPGISAVRELNPVSPPIESTAEYLIAQCRTARTANPRGPEDALIPYIIEPRNSAVLSDRPNLRWNKVLGVTQYTVTLKNGDTILWTKQVETDAIAYPSDAPALQPGINYTLEVKTNTDRSSTEEDIQTTFYRLSDPEADRIRQAESLFNNTSESTTLLKTDLYIGSELYAAAIDTLESLIEQGSQNPIVYRKLADLYAQANVNLRAESYYQQAIPLASGNLPEQARLQASLGEVYIRLELRPQAIEWLTQAKESYQTLGNQAKVEELQQKLTDLSTQAG